jgi:hypothetical protein
MHIIFTGRNSSAQVFKLLHHLLFLASNELLSAAVCSVNFLIVFIDFPLTSQRARRSDLFNVFDVLFGWRARSPGNHCWWPAPAFNNLIAANSVHRFGNNEQSLLLRR